MLAAVASQPGTVEAITASDLVDSVSGERIMGTIQDLQAFGSRALHLHSANDAAAYILEEFEGMGLQASCQQFTTLNYTSFNVVAQLEGSSEDAGFLLVGAHYDSVNSEAQDYASSLVAEAPGADDDASGVAAMLEIASVLADSKPELGIKFVAFGAEELTYDNLGGLAGSRAFVESEVEAGVEYIGALVLDMIGYQGSSDEHAVLITNSGSDPVPEAFTRATAEHDLGLEVEVVIDATIHFSDHYSFWEAGYPCTMAFESIPQSYEYEFNPYYHSSEDVIVHLSEGQIENVTKATVGALVDLAGIEESSGLPTSVLLFILLAVSAAVIITFVLFKTRNGDK